MMRKSRPLSAERVRLLLASSSALPRMKPRDEAAVQRAITEVRSGRKRSEVSIDKQNSTGSRSARGK